MNKKTIASMAQEFNSHSSEVSKNQMIKNLNIKHYLPIEEKRRLIDDLLLKNIIEYIDSRITYDSIDKTVLFMISVVNGYTDLECENVYTDFDHLMSSNLMGAILEEIGTDVAAYTDLFEMRLNDYIRLYNSIEAVLVHKANELISPAEDVLKGITAFIEQLSPSDVLDFMKSIQK